MDNKIPDLDLARSDEILYCIWYPKAALEATYRKLVNSYPFMAY